MSEPGEYKFVTYDSISVAHVRWPLFIRTNQHMNADCANADLEALMYNILE